MTEEMTFYLYPRSATVVRLSDGTPFYDAAAVGVARSGWPDLTILVGVEAGRPVLNRLVIERSLGPLAECSNQRCDYTARGVKPPDPAELDRVNTANGGSLPRFRPMPCPKCGKGELRAASSSAGPNREVFSGPEFSTSDLRGIPWDRVVTQVIAAVAYGAAKAANDHEPNAAASAAVGARRRLAPTDDLFQRVAAVVRDNPNAPTRAVEEQLFTSYRNASRWIGEARHRGLLTSDPPKPTRTRRKPS